MGTVHTAHVETSLLEYVVPTGVNWKIFEGGSWTGLSKCLCSIPGYLCGTTPLHGCVWDDNVLVCLT